MSRHTRINELTPEQEQLLETLTETPGFSRTANRIRIGVTLPAELAGRVAELMARRNKTASEIIAEIIRRFDPEAEGRIAVFSKDF